MLLFNSGLLRLDFFLLVCKFVFVTFLTFNWRDKSIIIIIIINLHAIAKRIAWESVAAGEQGYSAQKIYSV